MTDRENTQDPVPHELKQFVQQAGAEISAEYTRIRARAGSDPGTAGDEGEENWKALLSDWLPPGYHVRTKGTIITELGFRSPQVDVVVLSPSYPRKLLDKKTYLAGGIVAAFECKLTLRPEHVTEAAATAAAIRRQLFIRAGTPYRELFSPLIFGLLAHSHIWKAPQSDPIGNIDRALQKADTAVVEHPREMLDVLCVADLGTWRVIKWPPSGPRLPLPAESEELRAGITCGYFGPTQELQKVTPIGVLFTQMLRLIAREDPAVRPIADYWKWTGMGDTGGRSGRRWGLEVFSQRVPEQVLDHEPRADEWDEWSPFFL